MPEAVLLTYGAGNVRSAERALAALGARVRRAAQPAEIGTPDLLVLPGQGHFGQCMAALEATGLAAAVRAWAAAGRPFLGICVGMQLLFEGSEEAPGVPGLGLLPGRVERLRTSQPLPHVGWNAVRWTPAARAHPWTAALAAAEEATYFYHVHSYALRAVDAPFVLGVATYGEPFASVVGTAAIWGVQFHPEKSQDAGLRLLRAALEAATAVHAHGVL